MLSIKDVFDYAKTRGIASLLKAFLNKLNKFLLKQNTFFLGRTKLSAIPDIDCSIDFKYRNLTLADLEKMRAFRWDLSDYERWLMEGASIKGAEYNDEIIGFVCFSKKVEEPFKAAAENKKGDIWITYCNILPEFRGKKICPKIMHLAAKEYLEEDYECFHLAVDADNSSSLKMHERAGFKPYAKIKLLTMFGIKKFSTKKMN